MVSPPRQQAEVAKARLLQTVDKVKMRLRPSVLSRDVVMRAKRQALDVAITATDKVRTRPALFAGIVAATALILLRKPVKSALKRLTKD
jgi:hypothetical protein